MVLAMLAGGMLAAPLAAYVVRFVPARPLGLAVAGLLLLTQTRELATFFDLGPPAGSPTAWSASPSRRPPCARARGVPPGPPCRDREVAEQIEDAVVGLACGVTVPACRAGSLGAR